MSYVSASTAYLDLEERFNSFQNQFHLRVSANWLLRYQFFRLLCTIAAQCLQQEIQFDQPRSTFLLEWLKRCFQLVIKNLALLRRSQIYRASDYAVLELQ